MRNFISNTARETQDYEKKLVHHNIKGPKTYNTKGIGLKLPGQWDPVLKKKPYVPGMLRNRLRLQLQLHGEDMPMYISTMPD
jgi:hypothetical protein